MSEQTPAGISSGRQQRRGRKPAASDRVANFASDVLCHLRVAELLDRLGVAPHQREQVADGVTSCESLLARLRRLGRRRPGDARS